MAICNLGMGCEEAGVCFAEAHDRPDMCGHPEAKVKTYSDNKFAKAPFRTGPQPSDQAIAAAFWAVSHCQTHDAKSCQFIEDIIAVANEID